MRFSILVAGLVLLAVPAQAVEIRVLAPGLIGPGLAALAERWGQETGNTVSFPSSGASVGKIDQVVSGGEVDDLVLLPPAEFDKLAGKIRPDSQKPVGRVVFALAVAAGAPRPDISTVEKFRTALKGKSVVYNDPASGSLAGKMVDALLKQPGYGDTKAGPSPSGLAGSAVAAGKADMAVAVEGELVTLKGIDIVGVVPDGLGLKIDISGAVLASAAHPDAAAAFLAYLVRPQAATVWGPAGIAQP